MVVAWRQFWQREKALTNSFENDIEIQGSVILPSLLHCQIPTDPGISKRFAKTGTNKMQFHQRSKYYRRRNH